MSIWKSNSNIISKPWGEETRWAAPWGVEGKILRLKEGQRTSLKYYKRKNEVLFCLEGKAIIFAPNENEFGDQNVPSGAKFFLEPGQILLVEPENPYRIMAYTDCVLVEVTHGGNSGSISVMLEDDFGRVKETNKSNSDIIK